MSKARQLADLGNVYDDGALSHRNLLINSAMQVAQRGTSFSVGNNSATYTLDRWNAYERGDAAITVSQESDGPSGFTKSLKALVTAADTSLADPDRAYIEQKVEGQNSAFLDFGSSTAKTITVSFWVKSNVTSSNHSFVLANGDDNRAYAVDYAVSSSDAWEFKTITIDGDTSGTWDTDNSAGMIVRFGLGVPTGGIRAIAAGSWSSTGGVCGSTSAVNVLAAINNYIQITGVQLEVGDTATPFEHRSYGDELQKCQRYYQRTHNTHYASGSFGGQVMDYPVFMRATPTVTNTGLQAGLTSTQATHVGANGASLYYFYHNSSGYCTCVLDHDAEL